ncbi:aromatic-ring-hydroxylating dioxygenase subunit beta [Variovorax sp. RT4R15]|uniref:aromatic-ring-hydroxylating dioxygenase subunit beta n=1 Tax=Variovorax sp. RT4R15 TaxID=3443737 RepID=UPI003F477D78
MSESVKKINQADLIAFVVGEARLLDERRYQDWYELFADDGVYWIPLQHDQVDAVSHNSLMHEDKLLLRLRVERLGHARAFSQQPVSRGLHVLQQPTVERLDPENNDYLIRTSYTYLEARGEEQIMLGAVSWHTLLVDAQGRLRIRTKRVNLLNCDAALPSVQLFP